MADEHRTSSFPNVKPTPLSTPEKKVLKPKPVKPTTERVIGYLKEKGFSMGKKSLWYNLGEKKRGTKPPMKFSVGAGKTKSGFGAGFRFKVEF